MRGQLVDLSLSMGGKQRVTLELDEDFREAFDKLRDTPVEVTIKRHRARRSLDANAYAWVLIDRLAEELGLRKEEVYRRAIKGIGGVSQTVCVKECATDAICSAWCKNGVGWQAERFPSKLPGCVNVTLYFGSSTYDTRQMSALIDSLIEDCKAVGIEIKSPAEIESLLEQFERSSSHGTD